jgi:uncharacterized metal-binding protein
MKGWKKFNRTIWKFIKVPKIFDSETKLTSNVAINKLLSPIYFGAMLWFLSAAKKIPMFGGSGSFFLSAFFLSFISTFFYIWCSYFFQPDLDVRMNRPGMNTFPFGSVVMNLNIGFLLTPIQFIIGKSWYYFWQPYARLCTHRGVSHWPIVSVWYRITYILLWLWTFELILKALGIHVPNFLLTLDYWGKSFYPWSKSFGSLTWIIFCLPIFITDIAHEVIDYMDSRRKGISYCPPQIVRGLFSQIYNFLKVMIKKKSV